MDPRLVIGQVFPPLALPHLDRATLALFAGASGDHHPIHIDSDYARGAGVADVFGHGMLSMAWLARAVTSCIDQQRLRALEARFTGVVHLGERLTCTARVVEHVALRGERCARLELAGRSEHGDTLIEGTALVALCATEK